jgi:DNA processing protein
VNKLIQDGAQPVTNVQDILESLNLYMIPLHSEAKELLPENAEERALLPLLTHEPRHIDDLIRESALDAPIVSAALTMMELKGMVKHTGNMQFVLAR